MGKKIAITLQRPYSTYDASTAKINDENQSHRQISNTNDLSLKTVFEDGRRVITGRER